MCQSNVLAILSGTYSLGHLKDSTLTGKENGSCQNTLSDFTANTSVQAFDAFFLQDRQEAVQRGFVSQRISSTSL